MVFICDGGFHLHALDFEVLWHSWHGGDGASFEKESCGRYGTVERCG